MASLVPSEGHEGFGGKVALVTGAAGGIGQALTRSLQQAGARVALCDLDLTGQQGDLLLSGNLGDPGFCDGLPQKVTDHFGRLDMVFNNAGVMRRGKVTDMSDQDWQASLNINLEAPFRICRAAIPLMEAQGGGAIVNTASCWGLRPGPDHAVYCMTKAALASLTQCMGRDHAAQGIRINAVCPNEVDTPMLRTGFELRGFDPETAIEELGKTVPLGHVASPQEIADAMLFLASEKASYICGSLLEVNGGKAVS